MTNPLATTATPSLAAASSARLESEIAESREQSVSDFTDFLTLLTAQLKNQDPQAPLDATQFVEQLASFSAVEQQVGTNEKLTRLVAQGTAQEIGQLSGWIGQTVDARSGTFALDNDGLTVDVPEQSGATTVEAVIVDSNGRTVATVPVEDPSQPFTWAGDRDDGRRAAPGQYDVSFVYGFEDGGQRKIDAAASGRVIEARIDEDGPLLILDSGMWVRPADVEALRVAEETEAETETPVEEA